MGGLTLALVLFFSVFTFRLDVDRAQGVAIEPREGEGREKRRRESHTDVTGGEE